MSRLTIREARLIATTGEIHDPVKVPTEMVVKIESILAGADWSRADVATAHTIAHDELLFRRRYGM